MSSSTDPCRRHLIRFPVGQNVASRRRLANGFRCGWAESDDASSFEITLEGRTLLTGTVTADGVARHEVVDPEGDYAIAWWHWLAVARSLAASRRLTELDVQVGDDQPEFLAVAALHFDAYLVTDGAGCRPDPGA